MTAGTKENNMGLLIFIAVLSPVLITVGWMFDGEG